MYLTSLNFDDADDEVLSGRIDTLHVFYAQNYQLQPHRTTYPCQNPSKLMTKMFLTSDDSSQSYPMVSAPCQLKKHDGTLLHLSLCSQCFTPFAFSKSMIAGK